MKTVTVKARQGVVVPTPHGKISDKKERAVPHDTFIRNRIAEGDLVVVTPATAAKTSAPARGTSSASSDTTKNKK